MTPEDIKKARAVVGKYTVSITRPDRKENALAQVQLIAWQALDEVGRLHAEIVDLKTAMKNDIALYKEIMADVRGGKAADQAEELRKLNAVAEAAENIGRLLVSEHGHRVAYVNFSQLFDALDTWRAKK